MQHARHLQSVEYGTAEKVVGRLHMFLSFVDPQMIHEGRARRFTRDAETLLYQGAFFGVPASGDVLRVRNTAAGGKTGSCFSTR